MGEVTPNYLESKQGTHNWNKLILNVKMKRKESNFNQYAINFKHNPIIFNAILQILTWGYESSENIWLVLDVNVQILWPILLRFIFNLTWK
jgi:hypothetical protein